MGKMKQLPATASATHDWAHLTHAAAAVRPQKPQQHNTFADRTACCIAYNHCQCRSSIFYDVAEVLQQDAIDLIFLTIAWDSDLPIVELSSSYQLFKPAPDKLHESTLCCWTVSLLILSPPKSREKNGVVWKLKKQQICTIETTLMWQHSGVFDPLLRHETMKTGESLVPFCIFCPFLHNKMKHLEVWL